MRDSELSGSAPHRVALSDQSARQSDRIGQQHLRAALGAAIGERALARGFQAGGERPTLLLRGPCDHREQKLSHRTLKIPMLANGDDVAAVLSQLFHDVQGLANAASR